MKRIADRLKTAWGALLGRTYYDAADMGRLRGHLPFAGQYRDPNTPLITDGPTIIARIRNLKRNNPIVRGVLLSMVNAVWPTPPTLEPMVHLGDGSAAIRTNDDLERLWVKWARGDCDFDGWESHRKSFSDILHLATNTMLVCGEAFIVRRRRRGPGSPINLQLQVFEPDRLTPLGNAGRGFFLGAQRSGIIYDDNNRPIAYEFYTDPLNPAGGKERIEARDVIHVMVPDRPQMDIGDLTLASVLTSIDDLSEFLQNEMLQKAMLSRVAGIFMKESGDPFSVDGQRPNGDAARKMDLDPMTIWEFGEGEFKELDLDRPGSNFDSFTQVCLKFIAVGLGLPYSLVSGDYRESSYSAERMARLQTEPNIIRLRQMIRGNFFERLGTWFNEAAYATGEVSIVPGIDDKTLFDCEWRLPGSRYIDPEKERKAEGLAMAQGQTSPQAVAVDHGEDFYKNVDALVEAREYAEARGFDLVMTENGPYLKTADPEQTNIFSYHISDGVVTINEVREKLGFPPVPWGDVTAPQRLQSEERTEAVPAVYTNGRSAEPCRR